VNDKTKGDDLYITPDQLCVGLYVHIDLPWVDHPFTFSSFTVKTLAQIATIQSLGLQKVRYTPAKSDIAPLPEPASPRAAPPPAEPSEPDPAQLAKRAHLERLAERRAKVAACEKEFVSAARTIKSFNQNLFSQPDLVHRQAEALVGTIADSMLMDVEIAIQLMADKVGGEEVYFHSLNVTLLSMMLGKEMQLPAPALHQLGIGALFHDIGEVDIPSRIVRKTDPLTKAEQSLLQQHCHYGIEIGKKLALPVEALQVIAHHHERVDGSGYPRQSLGHQQTLLSRIVAMVNAYDELCNPVNAAKALTPHEALSTMYAQQRAHFDTLAINTFVRCMGVYPPGTVVVLSNGALGIVIAVNSSRPLHPTVLIYDPTVPKEEAIVVDLEHEPDVSVSRTLRPQELPAPAFAYLSPRKRMAYYFDTEGRKAGG
jgi:putative nucleotidyltransferase with HDIG domain